MEFFKSKWLVLLQNEVRFESTSFDLNKIYPESVLKWIPINLKEVIDIPYKISTTDLQVRGIQMTKDRPLFEFEEMATRPYTKVDINDKILKITVEMNLDQHVITRHIISPPEAPPKYAIIDLLADIGGIAVLIFVCLTLFLSFWNYNYMSDYLVTRLFRLEN